MAINAGIIGEIEEVDSQGIPPDGQKGKILDEALNDELIPPPKKVANPNNADRRKQCRYHSGHSTEECQALKDKIEELIQVGHLRRFVRGGQDTRHSRHRDEPSKRRRSPPRTRDDQRSRRDVPPRRDDPPRKTERRGNREVINTIVGGFTGGGSTNSDRKKHLRAYTR